MGGSPGIPSLEEPLRSSRWGRGELGRVSGINQKVRRMSDSREEAQPRTTGMQVISAKGARLCKAKVIGSNPLAGFREDPSITLSSAAPR